MQINHERGSRTWSVEVDGKDYKIVHGWSKTPQYERRASFHDWNVRVEPPRFYQTLNIYSRFGIHAGAKQLSEDSPVYKKVQRALIEHLGGWPT